MQTLNPYLAPILDELNRHFDSFPLSNEYEIIKHLQNSNIVPFDSFSLSNTQDLFSAHFLYMHALYHLKNQYAAVRQQLGTGFLLVIESVQVKRIELEKIVNKSNNISVQFDGVIDVNDPLESYYLDASHYFETKEGEINDLLKLFWEKYLAQDHKKDALATLNLPFNADAKMIKTKYLQLAQKYHPDKGGCAEKFMAIKQAKLTLDKAL